MKRLIDAGKVVPRWLWRLSLWALIVLGVGGGLLAVVLAAGAADPRYAGPLVWAVEAAPGECLPVDQLSLPVLETPFTLELTAAVLETGAAWGVTVDSESVGGAWRVLPPGYYVHAGQTWLFPHVQDGENVLRLDVSAESYTLRINQESAVNGAFAASGAWNLVQNGGVCWRRGAAYGKLRQN